MQVTLKDLPPRRKSKGVGGGGVQQDEDGREATQGCDCRGRPSLSGILPEALDPKGDLRVVYPKATELGFCTPKPARQPPGHTQAFVALHRASGAGSEAPACQDKPLRVTGASPQEQTLQRLGDGYAELVKASERSGWASSGHWGSQLPLTGCRVESGFVGGTAQEVLSHPTELLLGAIVISDPLHEADDPSPRVCQESGPSL